MLTTDSFSKRSVWITRYIAFCAVGIMVLVRWNFPGVLLLSHLYAAVYFFKDINWLLASISSNNKIKEISYLSLMFIGWCFVVYTMNSGDAGGIVFALKPLISGVVLNYLLGLYFGIAFLGQSNYGREYTFRKYKTLMFLLFAFMLFIVLNTEWWGHWLLLRFDEKYQSYYQTISGYLGRFLLMGVFICVANALNRNNGKRLFFIFLCSLAFGFFSIIVGSKKEPLLFILIAILIGAKVVNFKNIIAAVVAFFAVFIGFNWEKMSFSLSLRIFEDIERSVMSRIAIVQHDYVAQLERSGLLGNPYAHDTLGVEYAHSFSLSLFSATGIVGTIIFILFLGFLCLAIIKRKYYAFFMVMMIAFMISNIATFFDWIIVWFLFGLGTSLLIKQPSGGNSDVELNQSNKEVSSGVEVV